VIEESHESTEILRRNETYRVWLLCNLGYTDDEMHTLKERINN